MLRGGRIRLLGCWVNSKVKEDEGQPRKRKKLADRNEYVPVLVCVVLAQEGLPGDDAVEDV